MDSKAVAVIPPRKIGRPSKLTPELQEEFLKELRKGVSVKWAARIVGLNVGTVEHWILRGRGHLPDRPASPEFVAFNEAVDRAKASVVSKLAGYALDGAATDPNLAFKLLSYFDRQWSWAKPAPEDYQPDDEDAAYLRPGGGGAVAMAPEPDEPDQSAITLHERTRTIVIPAERLHDFTRALRGKDTNDDARSRLDRFRETAGDVPST